MNTAIKNLIKKFNKLKKPYKVAITISAILILWFTSGIFTPNNYDKEKESGLNIKKGISKVTVKEINIKNNPRIVTLYGIIESEKSIEIKPQTTGKIEEVLIPEGKNLEEGEVILKIEMGDRTSKLSQAEAVLKQKQIDYTAERSLQRQGYSSKAKFAKAKSDLEIAKSELDNIKLDIEHTSIKAPFNGFLDKIFVEKGDIVKANETPVAKYIDDNSFLAIGYVSQKDIGYIERDSNANIYIKNNGIEEKINGEVSFISKVAEESTRTFRIEVKIDEKTTKSRHGQLVKMEILGKKDNSYFVPASSITLDVDGNIGIKTVNSKNIVEFHEVEIISEQKDGMFIRILDGNLKESKLDLIIIGQNFVKINDEVQTKNLEFEE